MRGRPCAWTVSSYGQPLRRPIARVFLRGKTATVCWRVSHFSHETIGGLAERAHEVLPRPPRRAILGSPQAGGRHICVQQPFDKEV